MFSLAIKWGDARTNPVKEVDFLEEPQDEPDFFPKKKLRDFFKMPANIFNQF